MNYDWDFSPYQFYTAAFLRGTVVTIALSLISALIGTAVGIVLAALYRILPLRGLSLIANDVARAVPLLVLLFFFYFFPYQDVFGIASPSPFMAAVVAMSFSQAAFTADLIYSSIDRIPNRLILAARALGLPEPIIWRSILVPEVARQILPSLVAFYIGLVKLSSFASVIGCEDIVFVARVVTGQTFRSLEGWIIVAAIYVALIVPMTIGYRKLEDSQWLKRHS